MRLIFYTVILIFFQQILLSQSISGIVKNADTGHVIPFANILLQRTGEGTITNEDGKFKLTIKNQLANDTLVISHLGYEDLKFSLKKLKRKKLQIFELNWIGYDLPTVMITNMTALDIVKKALSTIKENYPVQKHRLSGFYKEEVVHVDGRLFNYGEGIIASIKMPYPNKPRKAALKSYEKTERTVFKKGFYEDFGHILVEDDSTVINFPIISQGGTLVNSLDIIKSPLSLILWDELKHYHFQISGVAFDGSDEAFVIKVYPKTDKVFFKGEIVINAENYAILSSSFEPSDSKIEEFEKLYPELKLLDRKYHVEYKAINNQYSLHQAMVNNIFFYKSTGDTLVNNMIFTTTERDFEQVSIKDGEIEMSSSDALISVVPESDNYWENENIILRSEKVNKALSELKRVKELYTNVEFITKSYESIKELAQKEQKLIFVDVYADWCGPCKLMARTTFRDTSFSKIISKSYIPYKFNFDRERSHSLIQTSKTRSLPSLFVVSPWGHIIYQHKGYIEATSLNKILVDIAARIDISTKFNEINTKSVSSKNMISTAGSLIIKDLYGSRYFNVDLFSKSSLGSQSTWKEKPELQFIMDVLQFYAYQEFSAFYFNNLYLFIQKFDDKEVYDLLYKIGLNKLFRNEISIREFQQLLDSEIHSNRDYYKSLFEKDYYQLIKTDEQKFYSAALKHYLSYPAGDWEEMKNILLSMIIYYDSIIELNKILEIHSQFETQAIRYEWLDLLSLIKFKMGEKEDALRLVGQVKALALEQGINYKSSLYLLKD